MIYLLGKYLKIHATQQYEEMMELVDIAPLEGGGYLEFDSLLVADC